MLRRQVAALQEQLADQAELLDARQRTISALEAARADGEDVDQLRATLQRRDDTIRELRAQGERHLRHPRSRALFDSFGALWLRVNDLARKVFDPKLFPQITPSLRQAMMDEPRLFFESIVRENERVIRLVDSDYTFLNEPLAL